MLEVVIYWDLSEFTVMVCSDWRTPTGTRAIFGMCFTFIGREIGFGGVKAPGRTLRLPGALEISEVLMSEWRVCTYWYLFHCSNYSANGSKLPPWSPDLISSDEFPLGGLLLWALKLDQRLELTISILNLYILGLYQCVTRWYDSQMDRNEVVFCFRWRKFKVMDSTEQGKVALYIFCSLTLDSSVSSWIDSTMNLASAKKHKCKLSGSRNSRGLASSPRNRTCILSPEAVCCLFEPTFWQVECMMHHFIETGRK